ncbi:MAG: DNA polymerase III subunit delta' [Actinobacteria bacterium]|nr:DNA polymerase III subunit delta' [Actinomycetota bacterium]
MLWDEVVGHEAIKRSLKNAVERGRMNHAYIFSGPSGVGKFMTARAFAAAILCGEGGCGECNICRRVVEEKHPDVMVMRPAGKNIPIEAIRALRLDTFRKPSESDWKVYIIKNAERMWDEGASTLLKVLEEPPGNVVFILVTANAEGMLPTIRSRCQRINFSLVPAGELHDYLVERKGIPSDKADLVVRLTGGVLGRALDWCDDPSRLSRRDSVVRIARALKQADINLALEMARELYQEVRAPVEEISSVYQERKRELADGALDDDAVRKFSRALEEECKREQLKEEIRGTKEVFSTLAWWYRDILILKEGGDSRLLVNVDLATEIAGETEASPAQKLIECIELLGDAVKAVEQNVPVQLNLESALLGIQEVLYA